MKTKNCPICGAGKLKKKVETESFEYKGQTKVIPNYITYACSECGEAIVDSTTLKESGKMLEDFKLKMEVAFDDEIFR
ncbi:MAG TPA: YgiT-type zinc finger protein [Syntrophales bacterium]|jgi:HTH-type transcriptional regulator/antitoxin MqsA|nr:YgiT-type zinc finger protein [Thermodesulfobacteriota bacterium]HNZ11641.1 YgiT-type zinc finger protein [Smithellaceae bacterium]HOD97677.1 YgiT-type zinc finger protein [Syntrophales bacterium]HOG12300.1 YgiT-type zinc finger protein [Smithellaceae bacterium]HPN08061.1 YgiT-type zinc finger protein [Syntrophales bacterium]